MKELNGDLWRTPADVRIITTNGTIKKDGRAVMGKGCADQAKNKYPGLDELFGMMLRVYGNRALILQSPPLDALWSFPVKHNWQDAADLELIARSAAKVAQYADRHEELFGIRAPRILLPRPGCGNGRLDWKDVKPVIVDLLDDRFTVVHLAPKPV